jgi:hypothetical protein
MDLNMPGESGARQRTQLRDNLRFLAVLALVPYVGWLTFAYSYHFLDGVNLIIHEAGHVVFSPLGETMGLLGGTVLQLSAPAAFVVHFLHRGRAFESAICSIWLAESLMYTGRYVGDARELALPLLGEIHDWNELLIRAGLLDRAELFGFVVHVLASGIAAAALLWASHLALGSVRGTAQPLS